ncbi:MAG: hypothetical protein ACK4Z6_03710, partial [Candidatus Methylomirabilales bacterium]
MAVLQRAPCLLEGETATTKTSAIGFLAALTRARGNFTRALYDYNVGLANLELALGTISKDSF